MRFGSICSGIEAASTAWLPLGWECAFTSEIEPFPSAVLKHHYPTVPNYGDITKFRDWPSHKLDVLIGGTPCQSFSVAGLRMGLYDPRGNLSLVFAGIVKRLTPRWFVWENVPGVLSIDGGRAFGSLLGALAQIGYGFAYRVLDAQYFGLAQRRKRVFVVGHSGGQWQRAAAVLFDSQGVCGDSPPSRKPGKGTALTISARTKGGGGLVTDAECDGAVIPILEASKRCGLQNSKRDGIGIGEPGDPMFTIQAGAQHAVAHSLRADGFDASEDGTGRGTPLVPEVCGTLIDGAHMGGEATDRTPTPDASYLPEVAWALQERDSKGSDSSTKEGHLIPTSHGGFFDEKAVAFERRFTRTTGGQPSEDLQPTLRADKNSRDGAPCVATQMAVRRLTVEECETLQGFPKGYTRLPWRGKSAADCPDGPRYKALGNSMAVPVIQWIGKRIELVDGI